MFIRPPICVYLVMGVSAVSPASRRSSSFLLFWLTSRFALLHLYSYFATSSHFSVSYRVLPVLSWMCTSPLLFAFAATESFSCSAPSCGSHIPRHLLACQERAPSARPVAGSLQDPWLERDLSWLLRQSPLLHTALSSLAACLLAAL